MKPEDLLNKKVVVESDKSQPPEPNKKLLKLLKSRKVGWMSQEEYAARREYLDELRFREDNAEVWVKGEVPHRLQGLL